MSEERIQVWHFIRVDHRTGEGLLKVEVGQTLTVEVELADIITQWTRPRGGFLPRKPGRNIHA